MLRELMLLRFPRCTDVTARLRIAVIALAAGLSAGPLSTTALSAAGATTAHLAVRHRPSGPEAPRAAWQPMSLSAHQGDEVGLSVAISGTTAVVGADGVDYDSGAAYVYVQSKRGWRLQATLTDPNVNDQCCFGASVAVAGSTAVIGSAGNPVYVFVRSGQVWHLQATLGDPVGDPLLDSFGASVAVFGNTTVVGAPDTTVRGLTWAGAAYVFGRTGTRWHLQARIPDAYGHRDSQDLFGSAVAAAGPTIVIGTDALIRTGADAFIYTRTGVKWRRQAELRDPHHVYSDAYGYSVGISAATAVIGDWTSGAHGGGIAYAYQRSGGAWHRAASLKDPRGAASDNFAFAVAISGTRILVGAPFKSTHHCGTAFEFRRSGSRWRERAVVINPGCSRGDQFGAAVALSGRTAIIGAPARNKSTGAAYVLTLP
jgi:hypothetical protein